MGRLMQHEDAIRTQAAERYVLGEMSPEEREAYEDHYFSCQTCGDELSATAAFVANARVALATPASVSATPDRARRAPSPADDGWLKRLIATWQGLVPALGVAVLALAGVVAYQQLAVIPELRQQLAGREAPQAVPTVALRSAARGAGPRLEVKSSDAFAVLQADLFPERTVTSYSATLLSADGEHFRTSLDAPQLGMPVTLLIPVRDLAPGEYTLVFQDHPAGGEAGRFTFTLERQ
jgi:anti-sigma factor RsiW